MYSMHTGVLATSIPTVVNSDIFTGHLLRFLLLGYQSQSCSGPVSHFFWQIFFEHILYRTRFSNSTLNKQQEGIEHV